MGIWEVGSLSVWKYCVVGNIVKTHTDKDGILRYGTPAFSGGTKVYLCGKLWNETRDAIEVLGLSRAKRWYVEAVKPCLIENVRWQKTFKPSALNMMDHWEYHTCWWHDTKEDKEAVKAFVKRWNNGITFDSARLITKLDNYCTAGEFDTVHAAMIAKQIDLNKPYDVSNDPNGNMPYMRTFLGRAVDFCNIGMVKLLLEHGADPNFIDPNAHEDSVLWDLQYFEEEKEERECRLKIAQMLLEYGADPCSVSDGEDLFSYVLYAIFNDSYDEIWEYRTRFFILLVAYGGKCGQCVPQIIKTFDKSNMQQYQFGFLQHEDGYHLTGYIYDQNGDTVAYI